MGETRKDGGRTARLWLGGALLALVFLALCLTGPPRRPPDTDAATDFSVRGAIRHVEAVAREPHPIGSGANDGVKSYLLQELSTLGVESQVQSATGLYLRYGAGRVQNVLARLPGSAPGPGVLLMAHYDSVAAAPGAGDDAAGVAVLLETARALRSGPRLRNDVIFAFTDGEEAGLLGAAAFAAEHPWAKRVGVALNFEARGSGGSSLLFETSPENGRLVRELARSAPHPMAASLMYEVYRRLPNDTDFSVLKQAGIPGLNFSFIGGWHRYHTPADTPANLDRNSLAQHGENALHLTRRLASIPLDDLRAPDAVYFNPTGSWLLVYPTAWALPAGLALAGLSAWLAVRALVARRISPGGLLGGALLFLLVVGLSGAAGWGIASALAAAHGTLLPEADWLRSPLYGALPGLASLTLLLGFRAALRGVSGEALALGGLLSWLALGVAAALQLPGASYLFAWPLVFTLAALILRLRAAEGADTTLRSLPGLVVTAAPPLLLWIPLLALLHQSLGNSPMGLAAGGAAAALLLWSILPQVDRLVSPSAAPAAGLALALLIVTAAAGVVTAGPGPEQPLPSRLYYLSDADDGTALWASPARRADAWTSLYLTATPSAAPGPERFPIAHGAPRIAHPAPRLALPAPELKRVQDEHSGAEREVTIRIQAPRGSRVLYVRAASPGLALLAIDGHEVREAGYESATEGWTLEYSAPAADGVELRLRAWSDTQAALRVLALSDGLPAIPGTTYAPRPRHLTATQGGDATFVGRTFAF